MEREKPTPQMLYAQKPKTPASAAQGGSGSVIMADDESILRDMGSQMLKRLGYEPLIASDGIEAVSIVRDFQAQGKEHALVCAILDLKMPGMDGLEALQEIKKLCPDLPVLIISGYPEETTAELPEGAKPQAFIFKPFDFKTLAGLLKTHARSVSC